MRDHSLCRRAGGLDSSDILLLDFILTLKPLLLAADADLGIGTLHRDTLDLTTSASLAGLLETGRVISRLRADDRNSIVAVHSLIGLRGFESSGATRVVNLTNLRAVFLVSGLRWVGQYLKNLVDRDLWSIEQVEKGEVFEKEGHLNVIFLPEELTVVGHGESDELRDSSFEEAVDGRGLSCCSQGGV
jgi:hypothetical protein